MAEQGKKPNTSTSGKSRPAAKSKPKQRAEPPKTCAISLDNFGPAEPAAAKPASPKDSRLESLESGVRILPGESEREKSAAQINPADSISIVGATKVLLSVERAHEEHTNSASDIVNYVSAEDKASVVHFLKDRVDEEKEEVGSVDVPSLGEKDNPDIRSEGRDAEEEQPPDSPRPEEKHVQDRQPEGSTENVDVTKQSYTVHEEKMPLSPPVEENDASESEVRSRDRIGLQSEELSSQVPQVQQKPVYAEEVKSKPERKVEESPVPAKAPLQRTQKIYETYEDFLESIGSPTTSSEPKATSALSPAATAAAARPPADNPQMKHDREAEEDIRNKAIALERTRQEAKERQKRHEIEEIKRKAMEKELLIRKNVAATMIQKNFRRFDAQLRWKATKAVILEERKKDAERAKKLQRLRETVSARKIRRAMAGWKERKRAENEDLLRKYMAHCATLIQKHCRGYRARCCYGPQIRAGLVLTKRRRALIQGWRTRKVFKCEKLAETRQSVIELTAQLRALENSKDPASAPELKKLKFQRKKAVEEFGRSFGRLCQSGRWLESRQPAPSAPVPAFGQ